MELLGSGPSKSSLATASTSEEVKPPAKTASRRKSASSARREELARPVERRAQSALAWWKVARAATERVEAGVEAGAELGRTEQGQAGGGELEREREPVELGADAGDGGGVAGRQPERRVGRARVRDQQRDRGHLGEPDRVGDRGVGKLERPEPDHALAAHAQRRLAGDEHARAEPGDVDGRIDDLLEVVEDQQHLATAEVALDERVVRQPERAADRRRSRPRPSPTDFELDHEAAVLEVGADGVGHGQREPGLADAARPDEGDDAALGAAGVGERGELDRAPDEPAGRGRDVAGARTDRGARGAAAVDGGERERGELGGGLRARGGIGAERPRHELGEARERAETRRAGRAPRRGEARVRGPRRGALGAAVGATRSGRAPAGGAPVSSSTSVQPSE